MVRIPAKARMKEGLDLFDNSRPTSPAKPDGF